MAHPQWWRRNHHHDLDQRLTSTFSKPRIPTLRQLKYLPRILTGGERVFLRACLGIFVVSVAVLSWQLYAGMTAEVPHEGGRYVEALVGGPRYVNPMFLSNNDVDRDISSLVYSGLFRYDEQRSIVPDLAENYEVNADQRVYTVHLRKDVKWHDGESFTADDVLFTIASVKTENLRSPLYQSYREVQVDKLDEFTVRFTLPKSFAPFIDALTIGILPRHPWVDIPLESYSLSQLNLKPIGTGAWKFKSFQKDRDGSLRSYALERNELYYGKKPYIDELVFKFYPDIDSAIQSLKNRTVDGVSFLPPSLRNRLVQDTKLGYYIFNLPQYTSVFFNPLNNPDLKSKAVRQALAYSIDKQRIIQEGLHGEGKVIDAPILEGYLGYNPKVKKYDYLPERATGLLETAGWKRGKDGMWTKKDKAGKKRALHVTLVTVDQEENARVADMLKEMWKQAGIGVDVQLVSPSQVASETIAPRNYEAFLYGEIIGADPDLYPFWHSSQVPSPGLNLAQFSNADADKLLEEGRTIADQKKRSAAYHAFQKILTEEVPAIFLYNPTYNYVVSTKIKGVHTGRQIVYPSDRFSDLAGWYIKSKREFKKD